MLFTGIMLTKSGPKALEYNARFGDPETQTLLPLLSKKTDLAQVMMACVEGRLHEVDMEMDEKACAVVIISSRGYPGPNPQGIPIAMNPVNDSKGMYNSIIRIIVFVRN